MQVLSLNTNGFSGSRNKNSKDLKNYNIAKQILKTIFNSEEVKPEIIIFSEFDVHSLAGEYTIKYLFREKGYYPIYPNKYKYISKSYTSIVMIFTKEKITSEKSSGLLLKWHEIVYKDYRIIGVHIPDSVNEKNRANEYWEDVLLHYQKYKYENVIYIGDMNVYTEGTDGIEKLNKLIKEGAKDAWIYKKGPDYHIEKSYTFIGKTRIDYAIMSQNALNKLKTIKNIQEFYQEKLSDHSALLIDLE